MDIKAFLNQLDNMFETHRIDEVGPFLDRQLAIAAGEKDISSFVVIINEMIGFYRAQKKPEVSVPLTEKALSFCREHNLVGTSEYATTLLNGATAYKFAGQPQKALDLFNECHDIYSRTLPAEDYHFAGLYNNIAGAYADCGMFEEAAASLMKAAGILEGKAEYRYDLGVTYGNLSGIYARMQDWKRAADAAETAADNLRNMASANKLYQQFRAMEETFRSRL